MKRKTNSKSKSLPNNTEKMIGTINEASSFDIIGSKEIQTGWRVNYKTYKETFWTLFKIHN